MTKVFRLNVKSTKQSGFPSLDDFISNARLPEIGLVGTGGMGGGEVGISALGAGAGAAGAGAAGGAAGAAWASGAGATGLTAAAPPTCSLNRSDPASTLSPSGMRSSRMTPAVGDGTGTVVLSVSISATT